MGRASQKFDRQLFTLKLSELSHQMQIKSVASDLRAGTGGASLLLNIVNGQFALLREEWLKGVDLICRDVWQTQSETVTPDFVREVLVPEAMTLIGAREGTIKFNVELAAQRTRLEDPHRAEHHLAMEIRKLKGEVANRYEIEARELEYKKMRAAQDGSQNQHRVKSEAKGSEADSMKAPKRPRLRIPPPINPVNTSGGLWLGPRDSKPTQKPPNPPTWFPHDLWPRTIVILGDAIGKYPDRKQLPELCRRYISKMTPLYCETVKAGKMRAAAVLEEEHGGMLDLLHSLLVYNDDGLHGGFESLSREARQIHEGARNSEEFRRLEKAIVKVQAEIQPNGTGADCPRTGTNRTESSHAQNSERTAQTVQSKPTKGAAGTTLTRAASQQVELGKGGVRFVRQGEYTVALPCGTGGEMFESSTVSAVRVSYDILSAELSKVYSIVKAGGGKITGADLRKQFRRSPFAGAADDHDWNNWADDFSPNNPQRGRPKGAALTFLERKTALNRGTIKSYLSRSKKHPKRGK